MKPETILTKDRGSLKSVERAFRSISLEQESEDSRSCSRVRGGWHVCVPLAKYTEGPRGLYGRRRRRRRRRRKRNVVTGNTTRWSKRRRTRRWWRRRTHGGSSQSSGWVSTRPVIIGAYLHEHTSNVPNQTYYVRSLRDSRCAIVFPVFIKRVPVSLCSE